MLSGFARQLAVVNALMVLPVRCAMTPSESPPCTVYTGQSARTVQFVTTGGAAEVGCVSEPCVGVGFSALVAVGDEAVGATTVTVRTINCVVGSASSSLVMEHAASKVISKKNRIRNRNIGTKLSRYMRVAA
jgi:hypothetical protein